MAPTRKLSVRVTPRAHRNVVTGKRGEIWLLCVRALPSEGEANRAVTETLAAHLGVAKSQISLLRGAKSRDKLFEISGLSVEELQARTPAES